MIKTYLLSLHKNIIVCGKRYIKNKHMTKRAKIIKKITTSKIVNKNKKNIFIKKVNKNTIDPRYSIPPKAIKMLQDISMQYNRAH